MALPPVLRDRLRLPVIASPLFIISGPDLVIAQCKAGIVGSFPSLNARPISLLDEWLQQQPQAAVRLLGCGLSGFGVDAGQADLFAQAPAAPSPLDAAVDDIRRRFGSALLTRASHLHRSSS